MGIFDALKNGLNQAVNNPNQQYPNQQYPNQQYPNQYGGAMAGGGLTGVLGQVVSQFGQGNSKFAGMMSGGKQEQFTFSRLPGNLMELQALPEATLNTPFKAVALCMVTLLNFGRDVAATWQMLEFLNGPDDLKPQRQQFIAERLKGKMYKVRSFFHGAIPQNDYTPTQPLTITVMASAHSFDQPNWATLYVKSGGVDEPRPIRLRCKPSTGQWFVNEIQCLGDMRPPTSQDAWA